MSGKSSIDLFEQSHRDTQSRHQPLAARMRPRTLEEFVGQEHIVGRGRLLYRAIKADQLSSLIFYGPPGTGKTSLAAVIANATKSHFVSINAVLAGVKEIRQVVSEAQERQQLYDKKTILFIDEVHRWNKAQQDALLPWVENGTVILIGATIENPYFEVNRALVSRSRIFQLEPLDAGHLKAMARQAIRDEQRGYGRFDVEIDEDALDHLVSVANGDARSLLNALELAVETTPEHYPPEPGEHIHIDLAVAEESIQRKVVLYDKEGDYHFDTISAFIKSLRGSDPDAALYWMAKMIYAGEDPHYIFRRMLILASEDIGMADPNALVFVEAAAATFDRVGMPEGRFHLAHAALYLATAPKSNSAMAFFDALSSVEKETEGQIPKHLKDGSRDSESFGHGQGYLYPHAYTDHWVAQQYLPSELQGKTFYHPGETGYEAALKERIESRREAQVAAMFEMGDDSSDILTFSPPDRVRDRWLARATGSVSRHLLEMRARLLDGVGIKRHAVALDVRGDNGFITWELMRRTPEGGVYTMVEEGEGTLSRLISTLPELERPHLLKGDLADLEAILEAQGGRALRFDVIAGRNGIGRRRDKEGLLAVLCRLGSPGARLALVETVPRWGQRLSELAVSGVLEETKNADGPSGADGRGTSPGAAHGSVVDFSGELDAGLLGKLRETEDVLYESSADPSFQWDDRALREMIEKAGFTALRVERQDAFFQRKITDKELGRWFGADSSDGGLLSPGVLSAEELAELARVFRRFCSDRMVRWRRAHLYVHARKPGG